MDVLPERGCGGGWEGTISGSVDAPSMGTGMGIACRASKGAACIRVSAPDEAMISCVSLKGRPAAGVGAGTMRSLSASPSSGDDVTRVSACSSSSSSSYPNSGELPWMVGPSS